MLSLPRQLACQSCRLHGSGPLIKTSVGMSLQHEPLQWRARQLIARSYTMLQDTGKMPPRTSRGMTTIGPKIRQISWRRLTGTSQTSRSPKFQLPLSRELTSVEVF